MTIEVNDMQLFLLMLAVGEILRKAREREELAGKSYGLSDEWFELYTVLKSINRHRCKLNPNRLHLIRIGRILREISYW